MRQLLFDEGGWRLALLSAALLCSLSVLGHAEVASITVGETDFVVIVPQMASASIVLR